MRKGRTASIDTQKKVIYLRLDKEVSLHDKLIKLAKSNDTSVNRTLVNILKDWFTEIGELEIVKL